MTGFKDLTFLDVTLDDIQDHQAQAPSFRFWWDETRCIFIRYDDEDLGATPDAVFIEIDGKDYAVNSRANSNSKESGWKTDLLNCPGYLTWQEAAKAYGFDIPQAVLDAPDTLWQMAQAIGSDDYDALWEGIQAADAQKGS